MLTFEKKRHLTSFSSFPPSTLASIPPVGTDGRSPPFHLLLPSPLAAARAKLSVAHSGKERTLLRGLSRVVERRGGNERADTGRPRPRRRCQTTPLPPFTFATRLATRGGGEAGRFSLRRFFLATVLSDPFRPSCTPARQLSTRRRSKEVERLRTSTGKRRKASWEGGEKKLGRKRKEAEGRRGQRLPLIRRG
jgi:hypothetical protein